MDDDCYSSVTVDDFGAAMLRGMGWDPNKPKETDAKAVIVKVRAQVRSSNAIIGAPVSGEPVTVPTGQHSKYVVD